MHAVDSEHSKNQQDDEWRISQLLSSTSNADHPFHKFGTGNLHTLKDRPRDAGIDVRKELLKFYRRCGWWWPEPEVRMRLTASLTLA